MMTASVEEENVGIESLGLNEEDEAILNGLMKEYPELFESREVQKAFKVCVEAHSDLDTDRCCWIASARLKFCAN